MKKKIINGILMSALLLAGTTSFVSCKDNVDDVETGIRTDMKALQSGLQSQVDALQTQVNTLKAAVDAIDLSAIEASIKTLQKDVKSLTDDVATKASKQELTDLEKKLQKQIDEINDQLKQIKKTAVTGVIVQETQDRIVGTINLPGFNPWFLASYVGQNLTGLKEFPIAGDDYNLVAGGNTLKASEINVDPVWNSGKNSYLVNGTGNAGKIYFTLNPRKVDPSVLTFDLINSTGEVSPVKLSDIAPSDHIITLNIGNHGNGMTRADEVTATADNKVYTYEANATVDLAGIEKIHFDYTKFGFQNRWDAGFTQGNTTADAKAQSITGRFKWLMQEFKNKNTQNVVQGALQILQDFYNGVFSQRSKLQQQALRVSWDDGSNDVISENAITTVTINPLSYKQMQLFDQIGLKWDLTNVSNLVTKLWGAIRAKLPTVTAPNLSINVTAPSAGTYAGAKFIVTNDPTTYAYDASTGTWAKNTGTAAAPVWTPLTTEQPVFATQDIQKLMDDIAAAINNGIDVASINAQFSSLINKYNSVKNATGAGMMARVQNYLNNSTNKILNDLGGNIMWRATEPTLLFESNYGINRLYPMMTLKGEKMAFIMTSMTEEYIVPAYMKYCALLVGGKVVKSYLLPGYEKIVQFDIPDMPCEIVYQTSDFYGNVVTKRYPLNR